MSMNRTIYNEQTKIWQGREILPLYSSSVSIGQIILNILKNNPSKICQINGNSGKKLTNEEIRIATIRVAQNFILHGFSNGNIVGLCTRNYDETAPIVFGCWTLGLIVHPINPFYTKREIVQIFTKTKPSLVICEQENLSVMKSALQELQLLIPIYLCGQTLVDDTIKLIDELFISTGIEDDFIPPFIGDATKQVALIHCSSGTTGTSKAVCLSHAGFLYNNYLSIFNGEDTMLNFSFLYWISGTMTLLSTVLVGTTRVFATDSFSPELMFKLVEKYKITVVHSSPVHLAKILDHPTMATVDFSSIRIYLCGGSVICSSLPIRLKTFVPNLQFIASYGLTEAAGWTHCTIPTSKLGSIGQNSNFYSVKIIDLIDSTRKCGINEVGEIHVKTLFPFIGYYNDKLETDAAMDDEGFLKTGDIGRYDENGDLYIIDRKKDILKYHNQQISPSEIEKVILNHPNVLNCCVTGIPDFYCTDLPAALIIKRENCLLSATDIYTLIAEELSDAKQLRGGVYFVNDLPFSESGKLIRRVAKDIAIKLYALNRKEKSIE